MFMHMYLMAAPLQLMEEKYKDPWVRTHEQKIEFKEKQQSKVVEQDTAEAGISDDQSMTLQLTDDKEGESVRWDVYPLNSTKVCAHL